MKIYLVFKDEDGIPSVCLNRSIAEVLGNKWEREVVEVETVDDYVVEPEG